MLIDPGLCCSPLRVRRHKVLPLHYQVAFIIAVLGVKCNSCSPYTSPFLRLVSTTHTVSETSRASGDQADDNTKVASVFTTLQFCVYRYDIWFSVTQARVDEVRAFHFSPCRTDDIISAEKALSVLTKVNLSHLTSLKVILNNRSSHGSFVLALKNDLLDGGLKC